MWGVISFLIFIVLGVVVFLFFGFYSALNFVKNIDISTTKMTWILFTISILFYIFKIIKIWKKPK